MGQAVSVEDTVSDIVNDIDSAKCSNVRVSVSGSEVIPLRSKREKV